MIPAKNYEIVFKFVKVMPRILVAATTSAGVSMMSCFIFVCVVLVTDFASFDKSENIFKPCSVHLLFISHCSVCILIT